CLPANAKEGADMRPFSRKLAHRCVIEEYYRIRGSGIPCAAWNGALLSHAWTITMSYSLREKAFHDGRIARVEGADRDGLQQEEDLEAAWQEGWDTQDEILRLRKEIPLDDALASAVRKFATAPFTGSAFGVN